MLPVPPFARFGVGETVIVPLNHVNAAARSRALPKFWQKNTIGKIVGVFYRQHDDIHFWPHSAVADGKLCYTYDIDPKGVPQVTQAEAFWWRYYIVYLIQTIDDNKYHISMVTNNNSLRKARQIKATKGSIRAALSVHIFGKESLRDLYDGLHRDSDRAKRPQNVLVSHEASAVSA